MFIGRLTAVGGAVIRDVLLAQRADIVQPGPYSAVAAMIGASLLPCSRARSAWTRCRSRPP